MLQKIRFLFPMLLILVLYPVTRAKGDLLVTPTRLVFEGRTRSAELGLVNMGKEPAVYRISLVNQRMTRLGAFERITTATSPTGEQFASNMIRFFPRQVLLQPGESQTIRVEVRKPAGIAAGEYRSHMMFRNIPRKGAEKTGEAAEGEIKINMTPVYGLSIPIIVRHGQTSASVKLENPRIEKNDTPGITSFGITLRRTGTASVYGDIKLTFVSSEGIETNMLDYKGIAVYTPNLERDLRMDWKRPEKLDMRKGKIRFEFTDSRSHGSLSKMDLNLR